MNEEIVHYSLQQGIVGYTYNAAAYHPAHFPTDEANYLDADTVGAVFLWSEEASHFTCDVCNQPLLFNAYGGEVA